MHNLEQLIVEWRKTVRKASNVTPEILDELENHLRATVDQLVQSGMTEADAFQRAATELGAAPTIAAEFQKLRQPAWLPVKVVAGFGVFASLAFATFLLTHLREGVSGMLLAAHVFTVTLGYTAALLIGVLGICFISQRCRADFSPRRLRSLSRATFTFARIATWLTVIGVVLGMVWSRREWGRFWGWDPKEIGALCVVVWLICFLAAHHSRRITARGLLVLSVLGSNIVGLAWFGPNLLGLGLHSYGMANYACLLLAAFISNLLFFLVGLAPAGWLRLRKA